MPLTFLHVYSCTSIFFLLCYLQIHILIHPRNKQNNSFSRKLTLREWENVCECYGGSEQNWQDNDKQTDTLWHVRQIGAHNMLSWWQVEYMEWRNYTRNVRDTAVTDMMNANGRRKLLTVKNGGSAERRDLKNRDKTGLNLLKSVKFDLPGKIEFLKQNFYSSKIHHKKHNFPLILFSSVPITSSFIIIPHNPSMSSKLSK